MFAVLDARRRRGRPSGRRDRSAPGVFAARVKGAATTRPRDLPYGERRLEFVWHKRRWWCREVSCPRSWCSSRWSCRGLGPVVVRDSVAADRAVGAQARRVGLGDRGVGTLFTGWGGEPAPAASSPDGPDVPSRPAVSETCGLDPGDIEWGLGGFGKLTARVPVDQGHVSGWCHWSTAPPGCRGGESGTSGSSSTTTGRRATRRARRPRRTRRL
ncbi:transposase family protein [Streptomyces sp. NPDC048577]|uniref:transposase family protein n=1 Tax=Streptomyces sp. NPDC048577 TaxID=3157209 RepID=UPI00344AEF99